MSVQALSRATTNKKRTEVYSLIRIPYSEIRTLLSAPDKMYHLDPVGLSHLSFVPFATAYYLKIDLNGDPLLWQIEMIKQARQSKTRRRFLCFPVQQYLHKSILDFALRNFNVLRLLNVSYGAAKFDFLTVADSPNQNGGAA